MPVALDSGQQLTLRLFATVQDLNGKPVESLIFKSPEGVDIKPLYTAEDVKVC